MDKADFKVLNNKMRLFFELCVLDIKQRTAGTAFGLIWLYLNPAMSMFIIWFVYKFGLKAGGASSAEIYRLLIGLIAWQFVSDALLVGAGAFLEKPYLVKKIKFPLGFLPMIKVVNSIFIHLPFLLAALLVSYSAEQISFIGVLEFIGILPFLGVFVTAMVFFVSTVTVFYRDLQSVLGLSLQLLFWATPIFWHPPENPKFILTLEAFNPFYFIVQAYRFCFLQEGSLYPSIIPFGLMTGLSIFVTFKIFNKLKDQFSDVL